MAEFLRFLPRILALALLLPWPVPAAGPQPLHLGLNPYLEATELQRRWTPLADYLGAAVGRPVKLVISPDYQAHIRSAGEGWLEIAYLGPVPYVQLSERYGPRPLLGRLRIHGEGEFRGVIAARSDAPQTGLAELVGRRFAFGDEHSTMSHILPWYTLVQAGVGKERLESYAFLNSHDNVALGVLMGRFDAGGLKPSVFEQYRPRGLKALAHTPAVPNHVLAASPKLPPELVERLGQALLALDDEALGRPLLEPLGLGVDGFLPARDEEYATLRGILRFLEGLPQ